MLAASPFPVTRPMSSAHGLNRGHQREGQRHRPQHVEAELSARLGVGGYPAGVVVGHAGDESRPHPRTAGAPSLDPKAPASRSRAAVHRRPRSRPVFPIETFESRIVRSLITRDSEHATRRDFRRNPSFPLILSFHFPTPSFPHRNAATQGVLSSRAQPRDLLSSRVEKT